MRKFQSIERHLRILGTLALIILIFLTACGTGGDSPSVSPTREVGNPHSRKPLPARHRRPRSRPRSRPRPRQTGSPDPERAALTALYDATGGQDWKIDNGWLGDGALDKWLRVITDEDGRVTESGPVGSNQLGGEIPAELGNLSHLELLYISDNNLTGALPQSLTGISGLESFHFHNNSGLCAPIDEAFQTWLEGIAEVQGSSCAPEDSPEDREVLAQLFNALDGENWNNNANWLTERPIREWHGVTNDASGRVTRLLLDSNELAGELPKELGSLSKLEKLELGNNFLSGEIPRELGNLSDLETLQLGSSPTTGGLSGGIPKELGSLSKLEALNLRMNQLTGKIPAELGNLSNLRILTLMANRLTGEIPKELGSLSNLRTLELNYNQFTGKIPTELGNLSNLNTLMLFGNQLGGCIPAKLRDVRESDFHFPDMPPFC